MADAIEAAAEAIAAQAFQDMGLPTVQWQTVVETVKAQYRIYAKAALAAADAARLKDVPEIEEIRVRLDSVTVQYGDKWGWESCGEKGDGSNMIGTIFHPDDEDAEHPLLGRCDPIYDEEKHEFREYYRDELIAEVEHRIRSPESIANFISHAPSDMRHLLTFITAQAARIEALEKALATERVTQVRGSNDAPGFEACVNAEIESIRATLEGK